MAVLSAALISLFYLGDIELSSFAAIERAASPSAAAWHDSAMGFSTKAIFGAACLVSLFSAIRMLRLTQDDLLHVKAVHRVFGLSSALAILVAFVWAIKLGMPSHAHSVGGVFYFFYALLLTGFLTLFFKHLSTTQSGLAREALLFAIFLVMSPAMMIALLAILGNTELMPSFYVERGHAYQVAAAGALLIPIISAHMMAIFSDETRRYALN